MPASIDRLVAALLCAVSIAAGALASESEPVSYAEAVDGLALTEGFIDVYSSPEADRVLARLPAASSSDGVMLRFIHALRLTRGLGSNPLGLDRGWGTSGRIVRLRRIGNRVVAEVENHRYRAVSDRDEERDAVAESFANSFVWSSPVIAVDEQGRVLVDLTGFLTADALGLAGRLSGDGGDYALAEDRSLPNASSLLVFPDNVEIDVWMTFTGDEPGAQIRATAAEPGHVTLVQHHSFVRLPPPGYRVREADPRTGTFMLGFHDFAAPLDEPLVRRLAMRHRLQYNEPGRPESGIREPLVFYVDAGAPDAIREALIEGAAWWGEAFAAAGFADGFRVEVLPDGAHPLDVRYNVIQWVHRQTRGWSYGGGIIDPRTGEMIKGHVILGSQRVRHDRRIFEGLAGVARTGSGRPDDPVELSLARIRQLSAHEIGHALGFGHNFAASSDGRSSVMDYPAPWVRAAGDGLDFSRAYDTGIGEWDKLTARWLYAEFPPDANERARLDEIVAESFERGLAFVADEHGRSVSTAHPDASVWDNGDDALDELDNVMAVRATALENFGADRIRTGRPLSELREVLVPVYLYHRYQLAAAAKLVGGLRFAYAQRGGPGSAPAPVPAERQRRAVRQLLDTLAPSVLDVPDALANAMPPNYDSYWFRVPRETLPSRTEPAFDPLTAAETAAGLTLDALFDATRAERLVRQHALDPAQPSLQEVIDAAQAFVLEQLDDADGERRKRIAERVTARYAAALMALDDRAASPQVRAAARTGLRSLAGAAGSGDPSPFHAWLREQAQRHLERPAPPLEPLPAVPDVPPGSPIGAGVRSWTAEDCWHCG
jgi:hypothetical protein